ncbi:hypothetical protein NM3230_2209 [Neisseria meningitidis NM3230]|nr:hypothetical protein NM3230_2209 [Neisseria meningitidis NM3230]
MFKRAIIFTSFNGFEKVSRTEKRRLAKIINSRVSITNEHLKPKTPTHRLTVNTALSCSTTNRPR